MHFIFCFIYCIQNTGWEQDAFSYKTYLFSILKIVNGYYISRCVFFTDYWFASPVPILYNNGMIENLRTPSETVHSLLDWFYANKRALPFREQKDAYKIWISEIMAQQTRMDTLIPYYTRFVEAFPTVDALAAAPLDEVLKRWEGLGYYSRAKNLKKAAEEIASLGVFPNSKKQLLKLPGIGPYTAGAIASIAFGEKTAAVDGNVLRVMSRLCGSFDDIASPAVRKSLEAELPSIMPEDVGAFNESLMELGALICTPTDPKCLLCPVNETCVAYLDGHTNEIPVKSAKKKPDILRLEALIPVENGKVGYIRRPETELLGGLYGFPLAPAQEAPGAAVASLMAIQGLIGIEEPVLLGKTRHVFTHRIWESNVYTVKVQPSIQEAAASYMQTSIQTSSEIEYPENEKDITLPTAFKKMRSLLKNES